MENKELENTAIEFGRMVNIPVEKIWQHRDNPRKDLGDLTELAESIKANGILQNLTVVPNIGEITGELTGSYTVIIGHRRLEAAKLAGLKEVPCVVVEMSKRDQLHTMLTENMQRTDLTVYEQAQGFQLMLDMGDTVEDVAKDSGFSESTVRRRIKLLELDKEKFKKSVERGATIMDYAELDKIDSPELKNKVLDSIGTSNFKNELKSAIEKEKYQKILDGYAMALESFAKRVEKSDYDTMEFVKSYYTHIETENVERPDDADEINYYFTVSQYCATLYRDKQAYVETEEDRQRAAAREELERKKSELWEITERHFALRSEFISEFGQAKKRMPEICKYAAKIIVGDGMYGRNEVNCELLAELLDLDIDAENCDYDEFAKAVAESAEKQPEYALLASAYAASDDDRNKYWSEEWNHKLSRYLFVYKEDDELDRLYDFLEAIGYEMSDEEKKMQNGDCPLLDTYTEDDDD